MRFQFVFEAADYDAAVAFYRDALGFPIVYAWDRGDDRGTFFEAAAGIIEVVSDAGGLRGPKKLGVAIEVDDIDARHTAYREAGVPIEHELADRPWGTREFVVLDPDGNAVTFFQQPAA